MEAVPDEAAVRLCNGLLAACMRGEFAEFHLSGRRILGFTAQDWEEMARPGDRLVARCINRFKVMANLHIDKRAAQHGYVRVRSDDREFAFVIRVRRRSDGSEAARVRLLREPLTGDQAASSVEAVNALQEPFVEPPVPENRTAPQPGKTLQCTDCEAMNLPTEWYCKQCGAELAAL